MTTRLIVMTIRLVYIRLVVMTIRLIYTKKHLIYTNSSYIYENMSYIYERCSYIHDYKNPYIHVYKGSSPTKIESIFQLKVSPEFFGIFSCDFTRTAGSKHKISKMKFDM